MENRSAIALTPSCNIVFERGEMTSTSTVYTAYLFKKCYVFFEYDRDRTTFKRIPVFQKKKGIVRVMWLLFSIGAGRKVDLQM